LIGVTSIYSQITKQEPGKVTGNATMRELETYLDNLAKEDKFSGAILVAKDGVPIFKKAYGWANKTANTANNTETKFNIGSNNKMFTSVAIAQLVERGKLSFDDTISKHLPDYPNKTVADKVTVHQLLTHTSGMGSYFNDKFFEKLDKTKTLADLLPFFAGEPLAFEPGTKWQYSNAGFTVLGLIIEKISGQNYFDYVRENIFKPAGMKDTDSFERGTKVRNLAIGYTRATLSDRGRPDPNAPLHDNTQMLPLKGSSAGGGYSTLDDMLKFAMALENNKLLSKKFTEIVTTGKFDVGGPMGKYAYGFGDKIFGGKHIVGHNGGGPGVGANFDMFPELGYTAVIFSNLDSPAMFPIIMKIRELIPAGSSLVSQQIQKPQNEKPLTQAEQEVRKLEREWLDAYEKRDAEAMDRIVADDFKLTFSDGRVQTKADILAQIKSMQNSGQPPSKLSTEDVQSRVEGETVILNGRYIQQMERDGQTRTMQMLYNDTYAKRQGRWQVITSQLTRIQPQ
jgi:CubicO group peptidase (beta-lactamase class C family)